MKLKDLNSLFVHELKDLYSAEKQLAKALPKFAKAVSNDELRQALQQHAKETESQLNRLDDIFQQMDVSSRGAKCHAMEGMIEEAQDLLQEDIEPEVLDAAIISAAQRVEHYEIAGYGTVRSLAEQLGMNDLASELQTTLDEEKKTNDKLNEIALGHVNREAMMSGQGGEQR